MFHTPAHKAANAGRYPGQIVNGMMAPRITVFELDAMLGEHCIDPQLALEHDGIKAAIRRCDRAEIDRILREEF